MRGIVIVLLIALAVFAWVTVAERSEDALVVYCAHDLMFAQSVLEDFERETGIKVAVVGDTEATKSLGLVERILRERENPRCDVFWNNQLLGTVQLAEAGVLEPYQGSGYERIPSQYKDPDGLWCGFSARLRVWIVHQGKFEPTQDALEQALAGEDLSRVAIAQPVFGTTLTHFSVLWGVWSPEPLKDWYSLIRDRGCQITQGNATVKNLVAEGVCDFGWTDTDDVFVALDDGMPVEMLPIRVDGKTICIPNTVAIIKGTQRRSQAEKLVDYLLSEKLELRQARSASRQIPLGPVDESELPEEVRELQEWARDGIALGQFADARAKCLDWLKREHAH